MLASRGSAADGVFDVERGRCAQRHGSQLAIATSCNSDDGRQPQVEPAVEQGKVVAKQVDPVEHGAHTAAGPAFVFQPGERQLLVPGNHKAVALDELQKSLEHGLFVTGAQSAAAGVVLDYLDLVRGDLFIKGELARNKNRLLAVKGVAPDPLQRQVRRVAGQAKRQVVRRCRCTRAGAPDP